MSLGGALQAVPPLTVIRVVCLILPLTDNRQNRQGYPKEIGEWHSSEGPCIPALLPELRP